MHKLGLLAAGAALALLPASCSSDTEPAGSARSGYDDRIARQAEPSPTAPPSGEVQDPAPQQAAAPGEPVPSPGCASGTGTEVTLQRESFDISGTARWYLLSAPEAATGQEPVPLVLDFHGLSEGAEFHSAATGYSELAQAEGFVVAFPHGSGQPVAWNISSAGANPDLAYVDEMLRRIEDAYCIDTSRVYATGLSNGAFMSSALACARADVFAAVAPVAGVARAEDCAPGRPVPVLSFHGTADPLLPFNGSVSVDAIWGLTSGGGVTTTTAPPAEIDGAGYPAAAAAWAEANGCAEPTDEQVTESVLRRAWDCPDGGDVVFYVVEGGGHTWPGSDALTNEGIAAIVGPTTMEIDATELSWDFLRSHRLPA